MRYGTIIDPRTIDQKSEVAIFDICLGSRNMRLTIIEVNNDWQNLIISRTQGRIYMWTLFYLWSSEALSCIIHVHLPPALALSLTIGEM